MMNESGLYLPEWLERRPTAIDLFCGCGGFSLGFISGGFRVVAAVDNDPPSMVTYLTNLGTYPCEIHFITEEDKSKAEKVLDKSTFCDGGPLRAGTGWIAQNPGSPGVGHFWLGDIRKISGEEILEEVGMEKGQVDCIIGGPPCQGFSVTGKREVTDPRNSLVFEYCRMVLEIRPKAFVFENVPGIMSMVTPEGLPVLDAICRILEDGGFAAFDTLKKSLLTCSGAGAALRGRSKASQKKDTEDEEEEMALF